MRSSLAHLDSVATADPHSPAYDASLATLKVLSGLLFGLLLAGSSLGQSEPRSYGDPSIVQPRSMSVQPARNASEQETAPYQPQGLQPANPTWQPAHQPALPSIPQTSPHVPLDAGVQSASYSAPVSLPTHASSSIPLSKAGSISLKAPKGENEGELERPTSSLGTLLSVLFSLGIVLSLFMGLAWLYRKSQPQGTAKLPIELVQILGRTNVAPRQSMMVVRFGNKLLLVSQQPGQTETLAEISDPLEVDRLAGICESKAPRSATQSFSNVLLQVAGVTK